MRGGTVVEIPDDKGKGMEVREGGNQNSHGRTMKLANFSKRMTVWSSPVHRVPGRWCSPRTRDGRARGNGRRENKSTRDCLVNCEVERVWQIVRAISPSGSAVTAGPALRLSGVC
ncbi:retrotransposon hot spot (RHS) protein [Trypanosoma cruzi]|nr:retrotransposon hot spot (RHS) protein [Trypanosoma cruzi]